MREEGREVGREEGKKETRRRDERKTVHVQCKKHAHTHAHACTHTLCVLIGRCLPGLLGVSEQLDDLTVLGILSYLQRSVSLRVLYADSRSCRVKGHTVNETE